jgi:hypothetical protein
MLSRATALALDQPSDLPLYTKVEVIELRRSVLLYARSLPCGSDRNQYRQIAQSLHELFKSTKWLDANALEG